MKEADFASLMPAINDTINIIKQLKKEGEKLNKKNQDRFDRRRKELAQILLMRNFFEALEARAKTDKNLKSLKNWIEQNSKALQNMTLTNQFNRSNDYYNDRRNKWIKHRIFDTNFAELKALLGHNQDLMQEIAKETFKKETTTQLIEELKEQNKEEALKVDIANEQANEAEFFEDLSDENTLLFEESEDEADEYEEEQEYVDDEDEAQNITFKPETSQFDTDLEFEDFQLNDIFNDTTNNNTNLDVSIDLEDNEANQPAISLIEKPVKIKAVELVDEAPFEQEEKAAKNDTNPSLIQKNFAVFVVLQAAIDLSHLLAPYFMAVQLQQLRLAEFARLKKDQLIAEVIDALMNVPSYDDKNLNKDLDYLSTLDNTQLEDLIKLLAEPKKIKIHPDGLKFFFQDNSDDDTYIRDCKLAEISQDLLDARLKFSYYTGKLAEKDCHFILTLELPILDKLLALKQDNLALKQDINKSQYYKKLIDAVQCLKNSLAKDLEVEARERKDEKLAKILPYFDNEDSAFIFSLNDKNLDKLAAAGTPAQMIVQLNAIKNDEAEALQKSIVQPSISNQRCRLFYHPEEDGNQSIGIIRSHPIAIK